MKKNIVLCGKLKEFWGNENIRKMEKKNVEPV